MVGVLCLLRFQTADRMKALFTEYSIQRLVAYVLVL